MNGAHIITAALILGALVVAGVFAHGHFNRFVTANSDGIVYVIDRRTGDAVLFHNGERHPVSDGDCDKAKRDPFREALDLVKLYHDSEITIALSGSGKTYQILPWRIYQANDQTYYAVNRVILNSEQKSRAFEVNLVTRRTRMVDRDETPSLWTEFEAAEVKGVFRDVPPDED